MSGTVEFLDFHTKTAELYNIELSCFDILLIIQVVLQHNLMFQVRTVRR